MILGEFTITNRVFTDALTSWSEQDFEILASEVIKSVLYPICIELVLLDTVFVLW